MGKLDVTITVTVNVFVPVDVVVVVFHYISSYLISVSLSPVSHSSFIHVYSAFAKVDNCCLPSNHAPFGLRLLGIPLS